MEHAEVSRAPASPEVRVGDASEIIEVLAADLEARARAPLAERRRFTLAIPGGSVATRCFPRLSRLTLDWSNVEFLWVDERAVPHTHADSNYALASRLWLAPAGVPPERIHRMPGEAPDLARAAREYADELTSNAGSPPRLDYVLLGVGADGHVASLFPGHTALGDEGTVVAITDAPTPPPRRLTLSLEVLIQARRVAIVAFGKAKAGAIREAVEDPDSTLPVARLARGARSCLLLVDHEAGSRIQRDR